MGIDLGGRLIVGCDITKCKHHETGETLEAVLKRMLPDDVDEEEFFEELEGHEYIAGMLELEAFTSYDMYYDHELDEPIYVGVELCSCGNRGEPISGSCSITDIHDAVDTVVSSLASQGFRGPLEVAFILGAS